MPYSLLDQFFLETVHSRANIAKHLVVSLPTLRQEGVVLAADQSQEVWTGLEKNGMLGNSCWEYVNMVSPATMYSFVLCG
jgi:hypothetical protein